MSVFKKLAGQTATYGLSSILGRMLNYLLVPLYTRVFHAGEYGEVTQLYAYVSFLNILFTYGLETAYFRFFQSEKGNPSVYSTALVSIIISSVSFGLLIVLFSGSLSGYIATDGMHSERTSKYISWFAVVIACEAITAIPFARLRQQNRARRFAFVRLTNILVNVGLNVFFLLWCPKALAAGNTWVSSIYDPDFGVGYVFLINLFTSVLTLVMLSPEIFGVKFNFDSVIWKQMIVYSFPLMIGGFAGMINETFDRILLPILLTDKTVAMSQLGIYGACYKLSILMTLFNQTFRYAAEPFFFSHSAREDAKELYAKVMNYFVLAGTLIFLGVMLYMDIFKYFIGKEYRSGLAVVPILLLANLFIGVYYSQSMWYKLTGRTRWGAWFSIFGAAITLAFNFWLIPIMGYMGAAWATLICYASMMVISYFFGQKYYPIAYDLRAFVHYIASALIIYFASVFIRNHWGVYEKTMLLINTGLLLTWCASAWVFERRKIGYLRTKN